MKHADLIKYLDLYPKGLERVYKKVTTQHKVTVTPDLAKKWLKKLFQGQRPISTTHVSVLAAEMKSGVWMDTGSQGIAFDWYGRLIDGQHRLLAVIESGVAIETSVVKGVDPKAYLHMDENTKVRSAGAYLVGFHKPNVCVSSYRILLDFQGLQKRAGKEKSKGFLAFGRRSGTKWKADRESVLAWCVKNREALEHVVKRVTSKEAKNLVPPFSIAAGFYLWVYLQWPEEADAFFTKYIEGDFEGREDPVYQLQRRILQLKDTNQRTMGTAVPYFQYGALLIKAWNAYMDGTPTSTLQFHQKEGWPALTTRKTRKRSRAA